MPDGVPLRQHREARRAAVDPHDPRLARPPRPRAGLHPPRRRAHARARFAASVDAGDRRVPPAPRLHPARPRRRRRRAAVRPSAASSSTTTCGWRTRGRSSRSASSCSLGRRSTGSTCAASSTASSCATASSSSPTTRPAGRRRRTGSSAAWPACTSTRSCASRCSAGCRRPIRLMYLSSGETIEATPSEQSTTFITTRTAGGVEGGRAGLPHRRLPAAPDARCASSCAFQPWCPAFGGDPERAAVEAPRSLRADPGVNLCRRPSTASTTGPTASSSGSAATRSPTPCSRRPASSATSA